MANGEVKLTAEKVRKREKALIVLRIILLVIVVLLSLLYIILKLIYEIGSFTVTLDTSYNLEGALVIYENREQKLCLDTLKAEELEFMTNITESWIPKNLQDGPDGSNNGSNYIAYTFYAENQGKEVINYWRTIEITDVIKNADDAIRVKVIKDGVETLYAKASPRTNEAEPGTIAFLKEDEIVDRYHHNHHGDKDKNKGIVMLEKEENFKPGDVHKYTVIIWIEGEDPECVDNIIGGEVKMRMRLTEEHIEQEH